MNTPSPPSTPSSKKEPVKVKYDSTVRYLVDTGVKAECPTCGHVGSSIITDATATYVECVMMNGATYEQNHSMTPTGGGLATFVVECNKCGYLRQFPFQRLVEWVQKNEAESQQ